MSVCSHGENLSWTHVKQPIKLKENFKVCLEILYNAWLDSTKHSETTGEEAICSNEINATFSTWVGYITGVNNSRISKKEIAQSCRTTEFSEADNDSELIIQISTNRRRESFNLDSQEHS